MAERLDLRATGDRASAMLANCPPARENTQNNAPHLADQGFRRPPAASGATEFRIDLAFASMSNLAETNVFITIRWKQFPHPGRKLHRSFLNTLIL